MKLVGVGLLAFLLAGLLIFLGQSGAFSDTQKRVRAEDQYYFSDPQSVPARKLSLAGKEVFGAALDTKDPLILSGLPSYSSQRFHLPTDARPVSGRYNLSFSSDIAEGLEGVLRITINGTKRADILLSDHDKLGLNKKRNVSVELMPSELASGVLDIGLSLQGRGPIAKCTPDDAIAAVVEIDPKSGLQLTLSKPVETTQDKLALWGGRVPVAWIPGQNVADNSVAIIYASRLVQKGYSPYFIPNGIDNGELARLAKEARFYTDFALPAAYPIPLNSDSANYGARKFDRQTVWRYHYAADALPGKLLPAALDLHMTLGPIGGNNQYNLAVTLNDHMLLARPVTTQTGQVSQSIALPADMHRAQNNLEITLVNTSRDELRCGSTSPSLAELMPDTVLRGGSDLATDRLSELKALLHSGGNVTFSASTATPVDANAATGLLAALGPEKLTFVQSNGSVYVRLVTGAMKSRIKDDDWVVYHILDPYEGYVARRGKAIGDLSNVSIALIVSFASNQSAQKRPAGNTQ